MGKELSLLSCTVYAFGIQNTVVVVKSGVKLWLHTGDPLIKLPVTPDRSESAAATPAPDYRGQGPSLDSGLW